MSRIKNFQKTTSDLFIIGPVKIWRDKTTATMGEGRDGCQDLSLRSCMHTNGFRCVMSDLGCLEAQCKGTFQFRHSDGQRHATQITRQRRTCCPGARSPAGRQLSAELQGLPRPQSCLHHGQDLPGDGYSEGSHCRDPQLTLNYLMM